MTSRSFIGFNFENRSKIDRFMILNLGPDMRVGSVNSLSSSIHMNVTANFFIRKCYKSVHMYIIHTYLRLILT